MSTAPEPASFVPARELPNGRPFYSSLGVLPFQADTVAHIVEQTAPGFDEGHIAVCDTGTGKTIISLATGAYLLADGEAELMVAIVENADTLDDWREAAEDFTVLGAHIYHGTGREKRLTKALATGPVHVLITTYETAAKDLVTRERPSAPKAKRGGRRPGELWNLLGLKGKRVFWSLDEFSKVRNRTSDLHKNWDWILTQARKGPHQRVVGLDATPLSLDLNDGYNLMRLATPAIAPSVAEFTERFVSGTDDYGRPVFDKQAEEEFGKLFQRVSTRKRKTDPDVACYFPRQRESSVHVELNDAHAEFYDLVSGVFDPPEGERDERHPNQRQLDDKRLLTLLRMTAGHPASHLHATNPISRAIAEELGPETLRSIGSSKLPALLDKLAPFRAKGWPVVVFTYFNVVLAELTRELDEFGISHLEFCGTQTRKQNFAAKKEFKAGNTEVLLCSDAAARGQNLQVSPAVIQYECPRTFALWTQRNNRVHRLTSPWSDVYCSVLIASDTVEDGVANLALKRNDRQDVMLGDTEDDDSDFFSARTRRDLLAIHPKRRRARARTGPA